MTVLLTLLAIALGPLAVTWGVLRGLRLLSDARAGGSTRPPRRRRTDPAVRPGPPGDASLGQLVDELGRLERAYRQREESGALPDDPGLRVLSLSYDATLRRCCAALDLPLPGPPPLEGLVRLEVEAALAQHGLSW